MSSFKQPSFQERAALAAKARETALEKLRAKPPVDPAVLAERREAELAREAARLKASQDKIAAREQEKALKEERQRAAREAAAAPAKTKEQQKLDRDARYAARKNRAGKR